MKLKTQNKWAMLVGIGFLPWTALQLNAVDLGVESDGSRTVSNNQAGNRIFATGGLLGNGSNPLILINSAGTLGPEVDQSAITLNSGNYYSASYSGGIFGPVSSNSQPVINESVANPITGLINNGTITGGDHGINAANNRFLLLNKGSIAGSTDDLDANAAIYRPGANTTILNTTTGVIFGSTSSAILGDQDGADSVTVQNAGLIQSSAGTAIVLDDSALVINSGKISGSAAAVSVGSNSTLYNLEGGEIEGLSGYVSSGINGINSVIDLFNWGKITGTGGTAVSGSGGNDRFYINGGSLIKGDINGEAGLDLIEVVGDSTGNTEVDGDLSGGADADVINITAAAFDDVVEDFVNGVVTITGSVFGNEGNDAITLIAEDEGDLNITGGIDGGDNLDVVIGNALSDGDISIGGGITAETITLTADSEGSSISVTGALTGSDGANPFTVTSTDSGEITISGGISLGRDADVLNISATGEDSSVAVSNGISAGSGADLVNVTASGWDAEVTISGATNLGRGDDVLNITANQDGTIVLNGAIEDTAGSDTYSVSATNSGLVVVNGTIDAGVGYNDSNTYGPTVAADTINLTTQAANQSAGSLVINGDIFGGAGIDALNIHGGLVESLDFSGDQNFTDNLESMRGTGANVVLGEVTGFQTLTKTGTGLALISGYDHVTSSFHSNAEHEVDSIVVTNGSLYLNGDLNKTVISGNLAPRTQITVGMDEGDLLNDISDDTYATEFGGTGDWVADVVIQHGGFSSGEIAINHDWSLSDASIITPLLLPPVNPEPSIQSIGHVDITGSLLIGANAHIRYDLNPQLDTTGGVRGGGADHISHFSEGNGIVSFHQDSQIRLSPTDVNRVISNGSYVVLSSDTPISGLPGSVSVQFNANVQDTGDHLGTLIPALSGIETANVRGTNLELFASLSLVANGTGENLLGQDLVVTIQHNYAAIGQNENQSAIGAAIDALVDSEDANVQDFISALDYSDFDTAVATLESISPENQLAQTVGAMSANYRSHRMLENYLASARSTSTVAIRQEVGSAGRFVPSSHSQNIRVWGTVSNDWQDYQDETNDTEYDGQTTAFTAGVDVRLNSSLVLGVMAEGSNAEFDYTAGSQDMDSMRFAAYGTWGKATGFYTNFALGYGNHDMSDRRDLGGIWGINDSNTDANSFTGLLTAGYTLAQGAVKHGPFLGLEYQNADVDGFAVNGGLLTVNVDDYSVDSLRGLVGYRAETTYGKFVPYASVAYAHEFEGEDIIVNANIEGSPFAVTTDTIGSSILMTAGSGYHASEDLTVNLGYRGEIATESNGIDSHGLMFGAEFKF